MEKEFWLNRWKTKDTAWHQTEVEPALVENFRDLEPTKVFVPLCGKSLDLAWLASQGHEVVGVELTSQGCDEFFSENKIPVTKTKEGEFNVYRGGKITIYNGDFFALKPEHLGKLGALYDRAALIALPPEIRPRYTARIREFVKSLAHGSDFRFLQIVLARTPHDLTGPPFSVPQEEVEKHYSSDFEMKRLSKEQVSARAPEGAITHELIFTLKRK